MKFAIKAAAIVATATLSLWLAPSASSFSSVSDVEANGVSGGGCLQVIFQKGCQKASVPSDVIPGDYCIDKSCYSPTRKGDWASIFLGDPEACSRLGSGICGWVDNRPLPCSDIGNPTKI